MLRSAKSFLNIPIISLYNTAKIGSVLDFVVDPDTGRVIGIIGERGGFLKRDAKVISTVDVREFSKEALLVDSEDALVSQYDIVKIDSVLKSRIKIFGNRVVTESGKYLGKVRDYLVDDFFLIAKLYVNPSVTNILSSQLIISRDSILKITKDQIIVSDSLLELAEDTEVVGATQ